MLSRQSHAKISLNVLPRLLSTHTARLALGPNANALTKPRAETIWYCDSVRAAWWRVVDVC